MRESGYLSVGKMRVWLPIIWVLVKFDKQD